MGAWESQAGAMREKATQFLSFLLSLFSSSPLSWKPVNLHTCPGVEGRGKNATHEKSTYTAKKEAVRWGSSWRTWVSLHLGGAGMRANSISSLNDDINQSISEERDSQGGLRAAGATAQNTVGHRELN